VLGKMLRIPVISATVECIFSHGGIAMKPTGHAVVYRGGCGGVRRPRASSLGGIQGPSFSGTSVGKCLKITEKSENKRKRVMRLGIQGIWGKHPKEGP